MGGKVKLSRNMTGRTRLTGRNSTRPAWDATGILMTIKAFRNAFDRDELTCSSLQKTWSYFVFGQNRRRTHLIEPGSTVISAAAISVEILKLDESATLIVPPACATGLTCENAQLYGSGTLP